MKIILCGLTSVEAQSGSWSDAMMFNNAGTKYRKTWE